MRFPELDAKDLEGREYTLPNDLPGDPHAIIVAFQRWHQGFVDKWRSALEPFEHDRRLTVWELPVLSKGYVPFHRTLDAGMAAGIPDRDARAHTLTVYTDRKRLAEELGLESLERAYVLLVGKDCEILWMTSDDPVGPALEALDERLDQD